MKKELGIKELESLFIGIEKVSKKKEIKEIITSMVKEIIPSQREKDILTMIVNKIINEIKEIANRKGIDIQPIIAGSFAKDTWLPGQSDIDLFIAFNKKHWDEDLSILLTSIVNELSYKHRKVKGSRDYYKLFVNNKELNKEIEIELVPIINIENPSQAKNTTDLSKLHIEWFRKENKNKPWLNNQVRLTKKFLRSINVYGSETHIKGFSGHVVDILISYFNDFYSFLSMINEWESMIMKNEKIIINPSQDKEAIKKLSAAKKVSPLIVIDPTNPSRNASAALSREKLLLFIDRTKLFLKKPAKEFFMDKPKSIDEFIDRFFFFSKYKYSKELIIHFKGLELEEKISAAKMSKAYEHIALLIKELGINIISKDFYFIGREGIAIYLLDRDIPKELIIKGPKISNKKHAIAFKKRHKEVFIKNGFLHAREKVLFNSIEDYIHSKTILKQWIKSFITKKRKIYK